MAYQSYPHYATTPSYAIPPSNGYYPPPTQHYQPAPPPPQIAPHDPFRAYYADRLRELTFNSRPLIQELSLLAMQQRDSNQWTNMTAVVEEIEGAVYRVCQSPLFCGFASSQTMYCADRDTLGFITDLTLSSDCYQ